MNTRGKKNERGASATEYGLMIAGIAAAIIMPMAGMGAVFEASCKDAVRADVVEGFPPPADHDERLEDCES